MKDLILKCIQKGLLGYCIWRLLMNFGPLVFVMVLAVLGFYMISYAIKTPLNG